MPQPHPATKDLSLVIPVYNEAENLRSLMTEIQAALDDQNLDYEVIFVDDGSQDESAAIVKELHAADERVVLLRFRRNFGQTAAFAAGFDHALGRMVVTLDADRQNPPADIPKLLHKLEEGWDVVNGWRKDRQDGFLLRRVPSLLANRLIARSSGVKLKDRGCSLRAFRHEVVQDLHLYGELHRFIPELVASAGYSLTEVAVGHRPRMAGESKYGISRTFRVLVDLITITFLRKYGDRPMHLFGMLGLASGGLGFLLALYLSGLKLWAGVQGGWEAFNNYDIGERPLLLLGVLLIIIGVQFIATGLIAELVTRTYHESQDMPVYRMREIVRKAAGQSHIT